MKKMNFENKIKCVKMGSILSSGENIKNKSTLFKLKDESILDKFVDNIFHIMLYPLPFLYFFF